MIARSPVSVAVAIVLLGALSAFAAALVPFYHVGYVIDALALAAVLVPFVLYAMFITSLRGPWLLAAGLAILAVTAGVVIEARFLDYDGYADGVIYWVPLVTGAIVIPVALWLGRRPPYE